MENLLTPAWTPLRPHKEQSRFFYSPARFKVVPAGRRSGKTELAKRFLVLRALNPWDKRLPRPCMETVTDPKYFAAAPTWQQAKRIYWDHLIRLIPDWAFNPDRKRGVSNSELRIKLKSGAEIYVLGLDKPERIEGSPWDGGILDEYGNMYERVWPMHCRPALADRNGWTLFIGVPEGRNHYFDLYQEATVRGNEDRMANRVPLWDSFTWTSEEILPPEEIEAAKRDLDPLTYSQEYLGNFISFHGICYYQFNRATHCAELPYDPKGDLAICFDFNVSPGVAIICQEGPLPGQFENIPDENGIMRSVQVIGTKVLGEVYIPRNSNTPMVARRVMKDWKHHKGKIFVYGDATGGAGGTTAVEGSDWDLVKRVFRENDDWNNRVFYRIPSVNPRERARVNAVNSRLKSSTGVIRMMIDPMKCHYLIKDFEGVRLVEGGSGEIDKRHNPNLTHSCFARGTKVLTTNDFVDVFDLPEKGEIKTFNGKFVNFSRCFDYNVMDTVELDFNGLKIESTLNHQFLTVDGWRRACDLENSYCVTSNFYKYLDWNTQDIFTELLTKTSKYLMEEFPKYEEITNASHVYLKNHIELFLNIILEKHHVDLRSIASTEIFSTIISQIYKLLYYQTMLDNIHLTISKKGEHALQNIVPIIVRELLAIKVKLMILLCSVRDVAGNLKQIDIAKDIIIQKNALKPMVGKVKENQKVYCPTVDFYGCFCLENNIIVGNSDALGYYIAYEFPIIPEKSYSKEIFW